MDKVEHIHSMIAEENRLWDAWKKAQKADDLEGMENLAKALLEQRREFAPIHAKFRQDERGTRQHADLPDRLSTAQIMAIQGLHKKLPDNPTVPIERLKNMTRESAEAMRNVGPK